MNTISPATSAAAIGAATGDASAATDRHAASARPTGFALAGDFGAPAVIGGVIAAVVTCAIGVVVGVRAMKRAR